jgi:hypothetical protein
MPLDQALGTANGNQMIPDTQQPVTQSQLGAFLADFRDWFLPVFPICLLGLTRYAGVA